MSEEQSFKPVIGVLIKTRLTRDQRRRIGEDFDNTLRDSGWLAILIDDCDQSDIRAFGVPENRLEEFEALKKLMEEKINANQ